MRLTIIRDDNAVYIDGRCLTIDCTALPESVRAVQWEGTSGHIEFDPEPPRMPEPITDLDAFASLISAWHAAAEAIDNPPPPPPPTTEQLFAYAAAKRWQVETGGIAVPGFGTVRTDERTQGVLTAGYVKALANPQYEITDYKTPIQGVYATLTAPQIIALADAVEAHVQACFSANKAVDQAILAGTITTKAEIDAYTWPSNG